MHSDAGRPGAQAGGAGISATTRVFRPRRKALHSTARTVIPAVIREKKRHLARRDGALARRAVREGRVPSVGPSIAWPAALGTMGDGFVWWRHASHRPHRKPWFLGGRGPPPPLPKTSRQAKAAGGVAACPKASPAQTQPAPRSNRAQAQPRPGSAGRDAGLAAAQAAGPRRRNWVAYSSAEEGAGRSATSSASRRRAEPANAKARADPRARHPQYRRQGPRNVVSFIAGYKFKEGSDGAAGGRRQKLQPVHQGGHPRGRATRRPTRRIVAAMLKGKQAVIKGASARRQPPRSTPTALAGFAKVIGQIDKACNVKR